MGAYFVSRDEMEEAIEKAVDNLISAVARYLVEEMRWEERIRNLEEDARIRIREEERGNEKMGRKRGKENG